MACVGVESSHCLTLTHYLHQCGPAEGAEHVPTRNDVIGDRCPVVLCQNVERTSLSRSNTSQLARSVVIGLNRESFYYRSVPR
jgi:hypothetical protein